MPKASITVEEGRPDLSAQFGRLWILLMAEMVHVLLEVAGVRHRSVHVWSASRSCIGLEGACGLYMEMKV